MGYMRDLSGTRLDGIDLAAFSRPKLAAFHMALLNRATTPLDILTAGNSVESGVGTSGDISNRWTYQMLQALRVAYPVASPNGGLGGFGYLPAGIASQLGNSGIPSYTGTIGVNGMGFQSVTLGAGQTWTWAATHPAVNAKIMFKRTTTDAFTVAANGGSPVTVTAGPSGYWTYTVPTMTRKNPTLVVTQTAGVPEVCGAVLFDGDLTFGIRHWDTAKSGAKASDFSTASGGSQEWLNAAIDFTPALVILPWVINDEQAVNAATFKTNVQNVITAVRAKWPTVSILLLGKWAKVGATIIDTGGHAAYLAALQALALPDPITSFLDLSRQLPTLNPDTYGFFGANPHPGNNGSQLVGQMVAEFLRPAVPDTDVRQSSSSTTNQLQLDTPSDALPAANPNRGSVLYSSTGTGGVVSRGTLGDKNNRLGRITTVISGNFAFSEDIAVAPVSTAGSAIVANLPSATSSVIGLEFTAVKTDAGAGTIVVTRASTDTINGATTKTLSGQYASLTVKCIALGVWIVIAHEGTIT